MWDFAVAARRFCGSFWTSLSAHFRIDVNGIIVTSSITNETVDELKLAKGMNAYAVIKASDVMVAID
jgi:molybdopterin-binding protein